MKPRLPLANDQVNRWGLPDARGLAPTISAARGRFIRSVHGMDHVDPVTTELVRIRNARHQTCYF